MAATTTPTAEAAVERRILLVQASDTDRPFARDLTHRNMAAYHHNAGLSWVDAHFDHSWQLTFNTLVLIEEAQQRHLAGLVRLHLGEEAAILWDLQLLPGFCGQGIGSRLMTRILDTCGDRGIKTISLDVYKANPAKRLYRRFGFRVDLETRHAVRMSRPLPYDRNPSAPAATHRLERV